MVFPFWICSIQLHPAWSSMSVQLLPITDCNLVCFGDFILWCLPGPHYLGKQLCMSSLFFLAKDWIAMYLCKEANLVSHMFAVTWCNTCAKNQDFVIECPGIKQSDHQVILFGLGQSWLLGRRYFPYNLVTCSHLTTSHVRQHSSARKHWAPHHMTMDLFDCAMISAQFFVAYSWGWRHRPAAPFGLKSGSARTSLNLPAAIMTPYCVLTLELMLDPSWAMLGPCWGSPI